MVKGFIMQQQLFEPHMWIVVDKHTCPNLCENAHFLMHEPHVQIWAEFDLTQAIFWRAGPSPKLYCSTTEKRYPPCRHSQKTRMYNEWPQHFVHEKLQALLATFVYDRCLWTAVAPNPDLVYAQRDSRRSAPCSCCGSSSSTSFMWKSLVTPAQCSPYQPLHSNPFMVGNTQPSSTQ